VGGGGQGGGGNFLQILKFFCVLETDRLAGEDGAMYIIW
jgi:hypothetical protein